MALAHAPADDMTIAELAQMSGGAVTCTVEQRQYYADAELVMDSQWQRLVWPYINGLDFTTVLDLAAGFGRNSAKLLPLARELIVVDINRECIDHCKQRFAGSANVRCVQNDGASLAGIDDHSVTLVYSFDSMVHFDSDVVRAYLAEFCRVLKVGGNCFCHHSNYTGLPGGNIDESPHRRNFMSKELFAHYAIKSGLHVVQQALIDWGGYPAHDCFTILRKA